MVVAFDPSKPITQPFVRVQVLFNVAHPLKKSRVLDLGGGKTATILFHYEKVQKRCFTCQRLNHEKQVCPLEVRKRREEASLRREKRLIELNQKLPVLSDDDPLHGVLEESQVGTNPLTGRPKIAKEVLEEMRTYLMTDTGEAITVKEDRVRKSVRETEKDPVAQKAFLCLEPVPVFTKDVNKGKGPVFDYGDKEMERRDLDLNVNPNKLMAGAFKAFRPSHSSSAIFAGSWESDESSAASSLKPLSDNPTVFMTGSFGAGSTGIVRKNPSSRKRPPKYIRKARSSGAANQRMENYGDRREGKQEVGSKKRKITVQVEGGLSITKAKSLKVVPNEGLPKPQ